MSLGFLAILVYFIAGIFWVSLMVDEIQANKQLRMSWALLFIGLVFWPMMFLIGVYGHYTGKGYRR